MAARCGKFLVVLALVLTTGLHWAALQTVAWTTMLAGNLRTVSFSAAMDQTFDGLHPCCLCKAIAAATKSGKKSDAIASSAKFEFPPLTGRAVLFAPAAFELLRPQDSFAEALTVRPLLPPPKAFLV